MENLISLGIVIIMICLVIIGFKVSRTAENLEMVKEITGNNNALSRELPTIMMTMSERIKALREDRDQNSKTSEINKGKQFYIVSEGTRYSTYIVNQLTGDKWNNVLRVDLHAAVAGNGDPLNIAQAEIACGYEIGLSAEHDIKYFMLRSNGKYQELTEVPEAFRKWFFEQMDLNKPGEVVIDPDGQASEVPA